MSWVLVAARRPAATPPVRERNSRRFMGWEPWCELWHWKTSGEREGEEPRMDTNEHEWNWGTEQRKAKKSGTCEGKVNILEESVASRFRFRVSSFEQARSEFRRSE